MIKYRIPLILTIIFTSLLLVSVIVLSILQTSTRPDLPNPDSIKIYLNSTSANSTYNKGSDEYNQILDLYNQAFEKSFLNQLADNSILKGAIEENMSLPEWSDANAKTGVFIEFVFDSPKKYIIYRNGNSRRVDIKSIIFQVTKENEFKSVNIYYEIETESSSSASKEDSETNHPLLVEANTSKLYNFAITKD